MDKEDMVYMYKRILFIQKNEILPFAKIQDRLEEFYA